MLRLATESSRCLKSSLPCVNPTTLFIRTYAGGPRTIRRPSRMVLSSRVADVKTRIDKDSPVQGLNKTVANIKPHILEKRKMLAAKKVAIKKQELEKPKNKVRPMKHMKMAQALAGVPREIRNQMNEKVQKIKGFGDFNLLDEVREAACKDALKGLEITEPTDVQALVIPQLTGEGRKKRNKGGMPKKKELESFLIAAETGSGKTLAYTIPIVDAIKRQEMKEADEAQLEALNNPQPKQDDDLEIPTPEKDMNGRPRAVVLVPTAELVEQVGAVIKSFCHRVKFRCSLISADYTPKVIRNRLFGGPIDIVVTTPLLFNSLTKDHPNLLNRCTHIVADEADSLFDKSFSPTTTELINRCENLEKLILCSATIPRSLDNRLRERYPEMTRLVTPNLHVVPRRVQLQVVDCDNQLYRGNRLLACADTLYTIAKDGTEEGFLKKVIVFVNEREKAKEVADYLKSKDLDAVAFTRDTSDPEQVEVLKMFTADKVEVPKDCVGRARMKVLVTTDIASRGVDTKTVKNVVLYDKPHSAIDMIHRIGRTGRMGRRGRAVVIVDKFTNKGWIKDIKTAMYMGGPLV
ncbi:P-loop containing nucleoside triphosphate hydrolase protein [Pyronema omphalodes]|nr:P-loop containing nucleoside triphosphate hydrolase protein [Pyronema omphalodes]